MMTNQKQIRAAFWESFPDLSRKRIGKGDDRRYCTDTRCAFVDYIDRLARDGEISPELAQRATLEG